MNNSITIKQYTDIPLLKSAVNELNTDIKNNPGLKYEIVGYSICKDETFCTTVSGILVRWEGTPFEVSKKDFEHFKIGDNFKTD